MTKVCILTSVHSPFDVRIFHKEAKSLAKAGYDVTLIAQHDRDEIVDGIKIVALPKPSNRIQRMTKTVWQTYKTACKIDADIYHFHDPELIPIGILLTRLAKRVIYDVHEDYCESIKLKQWIPFHLSSFFSLSFNRLELFASKKYDAIITATEAIEKKFALASHLSMWISNYPLLEEYDMMDTSKRIPKKKVCFVGGISYVRAVHEMIVAAHDANVPLILAGKFETKELRETMISKKEWRIVEERGYVNREEVKKIFSESLAGLILYHSHPSAPYSQPNKLFEYMAAGLPVIASNYDLWRNIVEGNKCGICVDPLNVNDIADAIKYIANNPDEAHAMGARGQKAVSEKYNWTTEEKKLIKIYKDLL